MHESNDDIYECESTKPTTEELEARTTMDHAAVKRYYRNAPILSALRNRLKNLENHEQNGRPLFVEVQIEDHVREVAQKLGKRHTLKELRETAKRQRVAVSGNKSQLADRLARRSRSTYVRRRNSRAAKCAKHVAKLQADQDYQIGQLRNFYSPVALQWFGEAPDVLTSTEHSDATFRDDDRTRKMEDVYERLREEGYGLDQLSSTLRPSRIADWIVRACDRWSKSDFPIVKRSWKGSDDDCSHAEDFSTVVWHGYSFTFSKGRQARSIEALWKARDQGGHALSQETIAEKIGSSAKRFRLKDVFRRKGGRVTGMHPAWGVMIHEIEKGVFQLKSPATS